MKQYINDCQEMFKLKYGNNHHLPRVEAGVQCGFMEKILTCSEPLLLAGFDLNNRKANAIESTRTIWSQAWYVQEWGASVTKEG